MGKKAAVVQYGDFYAFGDRAGQFQRRSDTSGQRRPVLLQLCILAKVVLSTSFSLISLSKIPP